jgi:cytoskeletal protein CcmA (bactofilin family)
MAGGNVVAGHFIGNGSALSGVQVSGVQTADIMGNLTGERANVNTMTATSANISDVVMAGGNVNVGGHVIVVGNVVAHNFIGNGALLTDISIANLNTITASAGDIGNVRFAGGNVDASGHVTVRGDVVAQHFVGNGALLTDITIPNSPAIFLSGRRSVRQTINTGTWAGRNIIMDSIQESFGISYDTNDGSFTLEGGVTYRVTAQLGWQGTDSHYCAFRLINTLTNDQIGPAAEVVGLTGSNGSSPVLDVIFTPRETGYYCLRMMTNVTASPTSYIRHDVGTYMNILAVSGRPTATWDGGWTKVPNWNFEGTVTAPTPATSAIREYSWSVTGKMLSMKGYYISTSMEGATAGNGEYLLRIPGGYQLHPTVIGHSMRKIPIGQLTVNTSPGVVLAHDSTSIKFSTHPPGYGAVEIISNVYESLHTDSYYLCFTIDVPIV